MKRMIWALALIAVIALAGTAVFMRTIGDDAAIWHVDPAVVERTGRPNDYLAAPDAATKAEPDRVLTLRSQPAGDLLFLFDSVVRPSPRVSVLAGSVQDGHITYVQRSMALGFPDYITVKTIERDGEAGLIVWSRSRYGYSDMGVNKSRVDTWLNQISGP